MDSHFVLPKEESEESKKKDTYKFGSFLYKLLPVFLLSAMLPLFLFFITRPANLKITTRASSDSELRIWFEPANIVSSAGNEVAVGVYALFESENLLIPSLSLAVESEGLSLISNKVEYKRPFNGQVYLGSVLVSAEKSGDYSLFVPKENVEIIAFDKSLDIISSPARIVIK